MQLPPSQPHIHQQSACTDVRMAPLPMTVLTLTNTLLAAIVDTSREVNGMQILKVGTRYQLWNGNGSHANFGESNNHFRGHSDHIHTNTNTQNELPHQ